MASNLNKAFMRAYAKDRTAHEATSAPMTNPANPVPMHPQASAPQFAAPQFAAPQYAAPHLTQTVAPPTPTPPAAAMQTSALPHAAPTRAGASPVMQPVTKTLASNSVVPTPALDRLSRGPIHAAPVKSTTVQSTTVQTTAVQATSVPPTSARPTSTQSTGTQATSAQATSAQATSTQRPQHSAPAAAMPVQAQAMQARPMQSQHAQASRPVAPTNAAAQASDVWRRIDNAHTPQTKHPANSQPRESVVVGDGTSNRRMQAAAAVPPAAPARPQPSFAPAVQPAPPDQSFLPLVGDDAATKVDEKSADSRRRTVADFLYAAGQYNPGRVLSSTPAPAATTPPIEVAQTSVYDMARDQAPGQAIGQAMGQALGQAIDQDTAPSQSMPSYAMPSHAMPVTQEPLPRRMGQILRVDVPRTSPNPAPMPAPAPVAAPAVAAAAVAAAPVAASASVAMPVASPAIPKTDMQPANATPAIDASTARYVIEQRRLDRAHKLNEAEEKLRSQTHKIFNPVWEVDNLQWPAVVDKLMQQRADSMAHVAAHLKSACQDGLNVLGVTSAGQSEGRTTVACCLARLAAMHGINVVLVDVDLDRPTLCIQTNMEIEEDWRDCLSTDSALEEVAVHSLEDQLTILPLKPRGTRPGLLASDGRIAEMLSELSESFELVIVDCSRTSSAGNVITGLAHTKIFDAAIVVVDRRDTNQARIEDAVRLIQQTGIESIGIVDNFSA